MKTPKQNSKGLCLKKSNNRWKWMAGATAATAAGVTASQASTITINLVGNYINGFEGNHLNADLTGDGHPDLTIANTFYHFGGSGPNSARVTLNGVRASCFYYNRNFGFLTGRVRLGSKSGHFLEGTFFNSTKNTSSFIMSVTIPSLMGSIPVFFKDLRINGGAPTKGSLEVTVSIGGPAEIQLDSLTYNDPTAVRTATVPDQGSSLALLAMGAGGIVALRRWRAAKSSNPQLPAQAP